MISPVSNAHAAQPVVQVTAQAPKTQPAPSQASPAPRAGDTVQISTAAKALLQEATETPAQTAQEARGGDHQALRLLAKEAAAQASSK